MKKYIIGFLSVLLLLASILGAQSKGSKAPKDRSSGRSGRPSRGSGLALWI